MSVAVCVFFFLASGLRFLTKQESGFSDLVSHVVDSFSFQFGFQFLRAHVSNTFGVSRAAFKRIKSDRDRNRKWAQGALSVVPEVRS